MISRRNVFGATLAGAGFARKIGQQIVEGTLGQGGLIGGPKDVESYPQAAPANKLAQPKMSRVAAESIIRSNPDWMQTIRSEFAHRVKNSVDQIDPDLAVLRSFSPMAKLVFTRQRRVEAILNDELGIKKTSLGYDVVGYFMRDLMWGRE